MKQTESSLEYFIIFILPIIFLALGLLGNIFGMVLLKTSKRLIPIGPVNTYRYLLLAECVNLVMVIVNNYLMYGFSIGFSSLNETACKIYKYTVHSFGSLSKFCLIYILIERYLAIKFPVESNFLRSKGTQLVYYIAITVTSCIYYMPALF